MIALVLQGEKIVCVAEVGERAEIAFEIQIL